MNQRQEMMASGIGLRRDGTIGGAWKPGVGEAGGKDGTKVETGRISRPANEAAVEAARLLPPLPPPPKRRHASSTGPPAIPAILSVTEASLHPSHGGGGSYRRMGHEKNSTRHQHLPQTPNAHPPAPQQMSPTAPTSVAVDPNDVVDMEVSSHSAPPSVSQETTSRQGGKAGGKAAGSKAGGKRARGGRDNKSHPPLRQSNGGNGSTGKAGKVGKTTSNFTYGARETSHSGGGSSR